RVTISGIATSGTVASYGQARTVSVDLTGLAPDTGATLFFDLLGFGATGSQVVIDDVFILTGSQNPPTDITPNSGTVAENALGATIATLSVADPDVGDTHTFVISDSRFEIVGGVLKLKPGFSLDFEAEPTVNLNITATDAGGLSIQRPFTVTVTNVN